MQPGEEQRRRGKKWRRSLFGRRGHAKLARTRSSGMADDASGNPDGFKYIGLVRGEVLLQGLAVGSGLFIGSSFVFKKKGLLWAQRKYETTAGESHAYLKSPMWWLGMTIMILGEVLNFVAYMFADAVLVTPMGALSVVVCAVLSAIFLKEHLTLFGKIGCFLCVVGSVIIAINAPEQKVSGNMHAYQALFIAPGFMTWLGLCVVSALVLMFVVAPRYGKKNMLVYITVCSVIGGLSVSVTSGLGGAIILSIRGENQFTYWFTYFLLVFIVVTLLIEINYLNKALELFNTAAVTPTYYVMFTAATLITSVILSKGMRTSAISIVTIVFGFFTICGGIVLLQLSKMDPDEISQHPSIDRKSSMLLNVMEMGRELEHDQSAAHIEDPGMDTIRGGMGIVGSIMRARSVRNSTRRPRRPTGHFSPVPSHAQGDDSMPRYQLYDRPVTYTPDSDHRIKFLAGSELPHGHHGWQQTPHAEELRERERETGSLSPVPILEKASPSVRSASRLADDANDADVGDATAHAMGSSASSYQVHLPPIWPDDPLTEAEKAASPSGIVDAYCDYDDALGGTDDDIPMRPLPLTLSSPSARRGPSRAATSKRIISPLRASSGGASRSPSTGLGLFRLRMPSRSDSMPMTPPNQRVALPTIRASNDGPRSVEEDTLLPSTT